MTTPEAVEPNNVVDKVAVFLRSMDGNDEIETCQDHEGDQAYGYRGDAQEIVDIVLKALAEQVPEKLFRYDSPLDEGWKKGWNACRKAIGLTPTDTEEE